MALNTIVCIKYAALKPSEPGGRTAEEHYGLNPFDRSALEIALGLKEAHGGTISAITMGPLQSKKALHQCLARGVDRAVLLSDPAMAGSDTLATATVLVAALNQLKPWDMVLFGVRSADGDTGHVGPQTMEALDLPMVTGVVKLDHTGDVVKVERISDGMLEVFQLPLPGGVTVHPTAAELRDVPLYGIEDSYAQPAVETWSLATLGVDPAAVGEKGSPTRVLTTSRKRRGSRCHIIDGAPPEQAEKLIQSLRRQGYLD